MLRWVDIALVRPPAIRVKPRDPKRLQQALEFEKDGILPPSKDIGQYGATVVIDRMPQPPWLGFFPHVTPHLIKLRGQSTTLGELVSAAELDLYVRRVEVLQYRLIYLLEVRFFFFNSFRTVAGLTCNTLAVSRIPLAF